MHLCELLRYYPEKFSEYTMHDTTGMFRRYGHNNVDVSWADFRVALAQHVMKSSPQKPSVFQGEYLPPDHSIRMRKRLLAAALREYVSAESWAEDPLDWLASGKEDDIRRFVVTLMQGVRGLREPPRSVEAASTKSIQPPPEGEILMIS